MKVPIERVAHLLKSSTSNIKRLPTSGNNQLERVAHILKTSASNVKGGLTSWDIFSDSHGSLPRDLYLMTFTKTCVFLACMTLNAKQKSVARNKLKVLQKFYEYRFVSNCT